MLKTTGIHHITAIVNDPQTNINFYTHVLQLRLIKKTVNFDRPEVYHLYFGNETGDPGTVITFFPWPSLPKGRIGTGQVGVTSFAVAPGTLPYWENRLNQSHIDFTHITRFNEKSIQFSDPDGLLLEITERSGLKENINAIQGFAGATLFSAKPNKTAEVLEEILGMECIGQEGEYLRFKARGHLGQIIDIKLSPTVRGLAGAGTVHHIAWRAEDLKQHKSWHERLTTEEYFPTEILDRNYFKALYFQEDGGIQFELATDSPGFAVDEEIAHLGQKLMLPQWLENRRGELEKTLPKLG
ncbi:ring-cleaving dioxygenase [Cytobacillus purgationiresistens]|uniref:Glyoxalase family protein n=1 Tax=Cytobacillus purgationiresistens TaxID=863449 RepID=A0ABU0ACT1_9BACI|nr:ring-cleaving dioxygenase [Cytobacillus purgationiresistens]MDQ0269066.1 glyoxalase family protein [Cytobacillus purgationiresistens]